MSAEAKSRRENDTDGGMSQNASGSKPSTAESMPKGDCVEPNTTKGNCAIEAMISACSSGDIGRVRQLLQTPPSSCSSSGTAAMEEGTPATRQDPQTGKSPLMSAAENGHLEICRLLLEEGAPWNAVDRKGKCAGNFATDKEHWDVVNLLVDAGTKAELILGATIRLQMQQQQQQKQQQEEKSEKDANHNDGSNNGDKHTSSSDSDTAQTRKVPVEHEPCTKPTYLQHNVRYNASQTALLDDDDDAVMMEWERPLMDAHASIICAHNNNNNNNNASQQRRILNVGFGMGIVDSAIQKLQPTQHVIIEAHPTVHAKMVRDGWAEKDNVDIRFGRWQDVVPVLLTEGMRFDGIFYDTYGEHFTDLEDFHGVVAELLVRPHGIYSFFNGLAPDNLFFHGVACQCVKLQLAKLGLDSEFAACDIQVDESNWDGIRRKYWHGNTYYLPIVTWNKEFLNSSDPSNPSETSDPPVKKQKINDISASIP